MRLEKGKKSALYKFYCMLETPKASGTISFKKNIILFLVLLRVIILKILQWAISRKPTDL